MTFILDIKEVDEVERTFKYCYRGTDCMTVTFDGQMEGAPH
jgi:hypothetical protein